MCRERRLRRCVDRAYCRAGKAIHRAVVTLHRWEIVLITQSQVQGQTRQQAEVVLHEYGKKLRAAGLVRVEVEAAAGWQPHLQCRQVLAKGCAGRAEWTVGPSRAAKR